MKNAYRVELKNNDGGHAGTVLIIKPETTVEELKDACRFSNFSNVVVLPSEDDPEHPKPLESLQAQFSGWMHNSRAGGWANHVHYVKLFSDGVQLTETHAELSEFDKSVLETLGKALTLAYDSYLEELTNPAVKPKTDKYLKAAILEMRNNPALLGGGNHHFSRENCHSILTTCVESPQLYTSRVIADSSVVVEFLVQTRVLTEVATGMGGNVKVRVGATGFGLRFKEALCE